MTTIRDVIAGTATSQTPDALEFARAQLLTCLEDSGAIVAWLSGAVGSRKSALLSAFTTAACDAAVIRVDCRNVEPTPSGVKAALCDRMNKPAADFDELTSDISELANRVVLIFEYYEVLRLADSWIRGELIPALDAKVRIVFSSHEPPAVGWTSAADWQQHFKAISLPADVSIDSLSSTMRLFDEISDPDIRRALTSLSISRRITYPMITALCPEYSPEDLYEKLAALSFLEARSDGLALSPLLQKALSSKLQAADPDRYRELQRAAWQYLRC